MPLIEWKDSYRTGFRSIDYEHGNLISSINRIYRDGAGDRKLLSASLAEIHALIEAHFALEEKIMRDRHYPAYAEHKQDHERLLDEILEIMETAEKDGEPKIAEALGDRLSAWFGVHFASLDKDLHTMLG